jgi:hypothetical protein
MDRKLPMSRRLLRWLIDGLVSLDQFLRWWLGGWGYVWLGWDRPNPDETISSWVGRRAIELHPVALRAEWVINLMFFWQVDENGRRNHCRRVIEEHVRSAPLLTSTRVD